MRHLSSIRAVKPFFLALIIFIIACKSPQSDLAQKRERATKRALVVEERLRKLAPLNKMAKQLKLSSSFVFDKRGSAKDSVSFARYICLDKARQRVLFSDVRGNAIFIFNLAGEFLQKVGHGGEGQGELRTPGTVGVGKNGEIIVFDVGNKRIQVFTAAGEYLNSFRIFKAYSAMSVGEDGQIYLVNHSNDPAEPLVDIYTVQGTLIKQFGVRLNLGILTAWENEAVIRPVRDGVLIAWRYLPIVRKYNKEGELIFENKLEYGVLGELSSENLHSKFNNGTLELWGIIEDLQPSREGYYILLNFPRVEILRIDSNGAVAGVSFVETPFRHHVSGFAIDEASKPQVIYLVHESPNNIIGIYN